MSRRSSTNRESGMTLIELLVAASMAIVLLGAVTAVLSTSLRTKAREVGLVEVQQSVRTAAQLIAQDLRAGAFLHLWHSPTCEHGVCSNDEQISIITTEGVMSMVPEAPGTIFTGATATYVCDARDFSVGDLALITFEHSDTSSGTRELLSRLVSINSVTRTANYAVGCQGGSTPNRDRIRHTLDPISGVWSTSNYVFRAVLATYSLVPDPQDADRSVLYRRTGLSEEMDQSGVVAFDIAELQFSYGVPVDASATASTLLFYEDLESAATALGAGYTADPKSSSGKFVGEAVRAVRFRVTGRTPRPLPSTGLPGEVTISETVEFRR